MLAYTQDLAKASIEEVNAVWAGIGVLPSRALLVSPAVRNLCDRRTGTRPTSRSHVLRLSISEQEACVKQFFLEECINSLICPFRLEGAQYVVRELDGLFPEYSAGLQRIPGRLYWQHMQRVPS